MSEPMQKCEMPRQRAVGLRGHIAGMIALVALFIAVAAWFWNARQPAQIDAGLREVEIRVHAGIGTLDTLAMKP